ncbi:MAG TPA: methylmalonyl Co-A mutase-associated GTPase MeaB [Chitinophagaceae bacterium]|nr:methylmalonyl Co-A mutase-associated GTPase MeaB [Chitinophagaceae bacterium]
MWEQLTNGLQAGDVRSIARLISLIENETEGYEKFLQSIPASSTAVIGITGPPGAGKSTLVDALIALLVQQQKRVAVLCVDPSSPFNAGAILGDRIRMAAWYNHPSVFIRSLATRGSVGGLTHTIIEITDLLKAAPFDCILVETVGVGQSEIEIAGLADITVVVLVPEAGDEIQAMKAGLMEVADIFAVNKADRPGADLFIHNLQAMLRPGRAAAAMVPVVKTIASAQTGVDELLQQLLLLLNSKEQHNKKHLLLAEKAWQLIQHKRMQGISKAELAESIRQQLQQNTFNLYRFVAGI